MVIQVRILDEFILVSDNATTLGKDIHSIIRPPTMNKADQTFVMATSQGEKSLWIQTC